MQLMGSRFAGATDIDMDSQSNPRRSSSRPDGIELSSFTHTHHERNLADPLQPFAPERSIDTHRDGYASIQSPSQPPLYSDYNQHGGFMSSPGGYWEFLLSGDPVGSTLSTQPHYQTYNEENSHNATMNEPPYPSPVSMGAHHMDNISTPWQSTRALDANAHLRQKVGTRQEPSRKVGGRRYKQNRQRVELADGRQRIECGIDGCQQMYADINTRRRHRQNKHWSKCRYCACCLYPGCESESWAGTEKQALSNIKTHQTEACKKGKHERWILEMNEEHRCGITTHFSQPCS